MDDLLFLIHPDEIEWDFCVLHPEHPGLCLRERKKHATVGIQMLAVHQSRCALLGRVGQLCLNDSPSREGNLDQPGCGRIGPCLCTAWEGEEESEEKRK